jgi:hypothetical protein
MGRSHPRSGDALHRSLRRGDYAALSIATPSYYKHSPILVVGTPGAPRRPTATGWPLQARRIGATAAQHRGPRPPVGPPLPHPAACRAPRRPGPPPAALLRASQSPPTHRTNVLPTRLRLSYNARRAGAAGPFPSVVGSAPHHNNTHAFARPVQLHYSKGGFTSRIGGIYSSFGLSTVSLLMLPTRFDASCGSQHMD